jgi:hypothetical protein
VVDAHDEGLEGCLARSTGSERKEHTQGEDEGKPETDYHFDSF